LTVIGSVIPAAEGLTAEAAGVNLIGVFIALVEGHDAMEWQRSAIKMGDKPFQANRDQVMKAAATYGYHES
jgi:hypothetical protein